MTLKIALLGLTHKTFFGGLKWADFEKEKPGSTQRPFHLFTPSPPHTLDERSAKFEVLNGIILQPKPKKGKKKIAAAPLAVKKPEPKKQVNPLFEKRPRNFGIGT